MSLFSMLSRKIVFTALGMMLLWVAIPLTASAHTSLERAVPAKDAKVEKAVNEIQMTFNTPIVELSSFTVTSSNNGAVTINDIKVDGSSMSGKPAEPLTAGSYTVQWKIVGEDSHPIEGSYAFTVTAAANEATSSLAAGSDTTSEAAENTDQSSSSTGTSSTDSSSGEASDSSANGEASIESPAPTTSAQTETTPADDATTDQKPASSGAAAASDDERDSESVSPATWIITIAVILIAIIAAVATISKRRKS